MPALRRRPSRRDRDARSPANLRVLLALVFGSVTAATLAATVARTGTFVYIADDAYIHLTLARNLATHATWGLRPGIYESAGSSPLWVLLLTPFSLAAPLARWIPLVVNLAAAGWILRRCADLLSSHPIRRSPIGSVAVLLLPITLGLVPTALMGMEHLLHAVLVIELLRLAAADAGAVDDCTPAVVRRRHRQLALVAALAMALRFETALVIAGLVPAAWLLAAPSRRRRALRGPIAAAVGAVVALASMSLVNVAMGQYPLPNSVLAKATSGGGMTPDLAAIGDHLSRDLLLPILAILLAVACTGHGARRLPAATMFAAFWLHLAYVDFGLLARYRAYLVIAGVWAVLWSFAGDGDTGHDMTQRERTTVGALLVVAVVARVGFLPLVPAAADDIHTNQEQMGRLLATHYPGDGVAVNDIGMVAYHHDGPLLDVLGLGTADVVRELRGDGLDRTDIARLAGERDVKVMVVFDPLLTDLVPPGWRRVARWCYPDDRVVLSDRCVGWFAPPDEVDRLVQALESWTPRLPDRVEVEWDRSPALAS